MAQVTIQLDRVILKTLEAEAARNHLSVSKWIKERILHGLKREWPKNYFSLFGSLNDEDLVEPDEIPFAYETKRENHGATLVTHNTKEFERIDGLLVEDWADDEVK